MAPAQASATAAARVPSWLLRFDPAAWEPGPAAAWLSGADAAMLGRHEFLRRRRAWRAAGRAWLAEHGLPVRDWPVLVHPEWLRSLGLRLQGDYSRARP